MDLLTMFFLTVIVVSVIRELSVVARRWRRNARAMMKDAPMYIIVFIALWVYFNNVYVGDYVKK